MMIREAQAQLAGPMYMNNREDAAIAVKGMESRVHQDNEELRKKGVKQYLHTVKKKHNQKISDKEAAVSTEVDLSKEQYEQVNEHMSDERNPGHTEPGKTNGTTPSRRRGRNGQNSNQTTPPNQEQTPEEKAKEEAVAELTKGVAATKTLHDKLARELGDVCLIEANLKSKNWTHRGRCTTSRKRPMPSRCSTTACLHSGWPRGSFSTCSPSTAPRRSPQRLGS